MSEWIDFVRNFAKKHNLSYKEAMQEASKHYQGGAKKSKSRSKTSKKKSGKGVGVGGAKKAISRKALSKKKGSGMESISAKNYNKYYKAGVAVGGILVGGAKSDKKKGALAALLEGLNANISVS